MEPSYFPIGIPDLDREILLDVPDHSLFSLCQTNRALQQLCQDPEFWRLRLRKYFPQVIPHEPYRQQYQHLYSLVNDGILLVNDQGHIDPINKISAIDLHNIDLNALKDHDYSNLNVGTFFRVDYVKYGESVNPSTLLLLIDAKMRSVEFQWDEERWQELQPLTLNLSPDLVISIEHENPWIGPGRKIVVHRHFTPELENKLQLIAWRAYKSSYVNSYYRMTPRGLVLYTYNPRSEKFISSG